VALGYLILFIESSVHEPRRVRSDLHQSETLRDPIAHTELILSLISVLVPFGPVRRSPPTDEAPL